MKQVGFKPGVKERGKELWMSIEQSRKSKEKEMIGEEIGESETEELVPE